ncbi:hypothetical protein Tco_0538875, partial [Tanacetum coccineum]
STLPFLTDVDFEADASAPPLDPSPAGVDLPTAVLDPSHAGRSLNCYIRSLT